MEELKGKTVSNSTNRVSNLCLKYEGINSILFPMKTSKFEWTLDNIRIEKIILASIWATKSFLGGDFSST